MKLILHVTLICCGALLGLLFAELALHCVDVPRLLFKPSVRWSHWSDPQHPEAQTFFQQRYSYSESVGFERNEVAREIARASQEHFDFKILLLGDSLSEMQGYAQALQKRIPARYPMKRLAFVNAGTVGYDTSLELRLFQARGRQLRPHLVLLQFNTNDFMETPVIIPEGSSWLAFNGARPGSLWSQRLLSASRVFQLLTVADLYLWPLREVFSDEEAKSAAARARVEEPLRELQREIEESGADFRIIEFPDFAEEGVQEQLDSHKLFSRIVRHLGLEAKVINLLPAYRGMSLRALSAFYAHPNERGHAIAADAILRELTPYLDQILH